MPKPELARWKGPARQMRWRFSAVDRWATYAETELSILRFAPVLVFSMGKTGTTSLTTAVEASGRRTMKAHALSAEGIAVRIADHRRLRTGSRPRFIWRTQSIRFDIRWRRWGRWNVISAVRDPVALAISAHLYSAAARKAPSLEATGGLEVHGAEVERILIKTAIDQDWFADELRPITGLDVYAESFDASAGYRLYENDRFRAVLIRQENLETDGASALASLLREPVAMPTTRRNSGEQAAYGALYARFRNEWRFDRELLERVYSQQAVAHFYTEPERAAMLSRWSRE